MTTHDAYPVETILKEISDLVNSIDDLDKVTEEIVRLTTTLLKVGTCSLVMVEAGSDQMRMCAACGLNPEVMAKFNQRVGEGITGYVAKTGEPLLIEDVETHPLFHRKSRRRYSTKSLLSVPLLHNKDTIGVLNVNNRNDGGVFTKSDELILSVLANLCVIAIDKAQMREKLVEHERYEAELRVAREIQELILPQELPHNARWEFAARNVPAHEVAGDFFDAISLPGDRTFVVLGDVCGKGVPAALYMARVMGYFHVMAEMQPTAQEIMCSVNRVMADEWSDRTFLTATLCLLDNTRNRMSICSAGHPAPYRLRQSTGEVSVVDVGQGLPLGIDVDMAYEALEIEAEPGDSFVLYTDGITEAKGPGDAMFREAGLEAALKGYTGAAEGLTERIVQAVSDFAGGEPQSDDLTLFVMRCS